MSELPRKSELDDCLNGFEQMEGPCTTEEALSRVANHFVSSQTYKPVSNGQADGWFQESERQYKGELHLSGITWLARARQLLAERKHLLGLLEPFDWAAKCMATDGYQYSDSETLTVSDDYRLDTTVGDLRAAAQAIKERGQEM